MGKEFNKGKISLEMLIGSLSVLRKIFGSFTPIDDALLERASMLSFRLNDGRVTNLNDVPTFGIYDCLYIALALQSDSELVTADQKQAELARYHGVMTHLI